MATHQQQDEAHLAALGDELAYMAERAFEAYARVEPQHAAALRAGVQAGKVRLQLRVVSGGGVDSVLDATAIEADGSAHRIARMTVTPISLN